MAAINRKHINALNQLLMRGYTKRKDIMAITVPELLDMKTFCTDRMSDHIPYSFDRECHAFRVMTNENVWYIACTPWNERRRFTIYGYKRMPLMTALAKSRGLPESCYGVLKFTGERVYIRFGSRELERFPQYGSNAEVNRAFANEKNKELNLRQKPLLLWQKAW